MSCQILILHRQRIESSVNIKQTFYFLAINVRCEAGQHTLDVIKDWIDSDHLVFSTGYACGMPIDKIATSDRLYHIFN